MSSKGKAPSAGPQPPRPLQKPPLGPSSPRISGDTTGESARQRSRNHLLQLLSDTVHIFHSFLIPFFLLELLSALNCHVFKFIIIFINQITSIRLHTLSRYTLAAHIQGPLKGHSVTRPLETTVVLVGQRTLLHSNGTEMELETTRNGMKQAPKRPTDDSKAPPHRLWRSSRPYCSFA